MNITRRILLTSSAAAIAAPLLPSLTACATPTIIGVDMASGPEMVMWAVGTPECFDWQPVLARTAKEAFEHYLEAWGQEPDDISGDPDEYVCRMPTWDGKVPDQIFKADWITGGMGAICDRCNEEAYSDSGAQVIAGEVVCQDCQTLADLIDYDIEDALDEMANQIACNGEEDTRAWAVREGGDALTDDIWRQAVARAAT